MVKNGTFPGGVNSGDWSNGNIPRAYKYADLPTEKTLALYGGKEKEDKEPSVEQRPGGDEMVATNDSNDSNDAWLIISLILTTLIALAGGAFGLRNRLVIAERIRHFMSDRGKRDPPAESTRTTEMFRLASTPTSSIPDDTVPWEEFEIPFDASTALRNVKTSPLMVEVQTISGGFIVDGEEMSAEDALTLIIDYLDESLTSFRGLTRGDFLSAVIGAERKHPLWMVDLSFMESEPELYFNSSPDVSMHDVSKVVKAEVASGRKALALVEAEDFMTAMFGNPNPKPDVVAPSQPTLPLNVELEKEKIKAELALEVAKQETLRLQMRLDYDRSMAAMAMEQAEKRFEVLVPNEEGKMEKRLVTKAELEVLTKAAETAGLVAERIRADAGPSQLDKELIIASIEAQRAIAEANNKAAANSQSATERWIQLGVGTGVNVATAGLQTLAMYKIFKGAGRVSGPAAAAGGGSVAPGGIPGGPTNVTLRTTAGSSTPFLQKMSLRRQAATINVASAAPAI